MDRLIELTDLLKQASSAYYNSETSIITDKEFDDLTDELRTLETSLGIVLPYSPTNNVGYEVIGKLEKVKHSTAMLSLAKTKDIHELEKFLGNRDGILSWKEDGLSIVLTYNNGVLEDAVTRGNGEIGSRVLNNAKAFKAGIPQSINYKGHLIIRGESLISKQDFTELNTTGEYANPRNLTSGSLMALDSKITKQRRLQFKAFSIAECDKEFTLYSEQLIWLKEIGFNPVEYYRVDKIDLEDYVQLMKDKINDYSFMTDGLVVKFQDLEYGKTLGFTSHHRLDSLAFKWTDTTVETTLRDITFQVGRTGVLTPVAQFDSVLIEQSMVSKASLHNISILESLKLGVSDKILVYKANLIIPQLDSNLTQSNTFQLPTECPMCGGKVEVRQVNESKSLVCINPNCKAKLVQKFQHYCSRDAMNILGVSEAILEKFIDKGFIKTIPNLYKLGKYESQIVNLPGFGRKSYDKIIAAINISVQCKLENLIFALGINQIGKGGAKILAKQFKTMDDFIDAINMGFNFSELEDIGEITETAIYEWFENDENKAMVYELLDILEFEEEEIKVNDKGIFTGMKLYCTGSFASHKKDELKAIVENLGGEFASGYAKSLSMLVVGSLKGSSKTLKAEKDGVKIVTEDEFLEMIK